MIPTTNNTYQGHKTLQSGGFQAGPRNSPKTAISGPRNGKNGATIILGPETDQMVQFLGPETDIMGERNFMNLADHLEGTYGPNIGFGGTLWSILRV